MAVDRFKRKVALEDKLFVLMEKTVELLTTRVESGECSAADLQVVTGLLKHNKVDLEFAGNKGNDPDLPAEDELPFTEGPLVSCEP